ncbi:MAG: outer membrane protein assembly factor BamB, partial [Verrucomicrobiota bacterium]
FAATGGKGGLFANAFFIENAGRWFIWNDQGELILARLTPAKFDEIGRVKLLETAENTRGRDVLWCHPAFAGKNLFVHNGRQLIAVSLARNGSGPTESK